MSAALTSSPKQFQKLDTPTHRLHSMPTSEPDFLHEELARAEAYVRTLRRELNFRSPVARLPIEVLALIFSYFPASDEDLPRRAAPPPTWLAVTHVCQRWRQLTDNLCPST